MTKTILLLPLVLLTGILSACAGAAPSQPAAEGGASCAYTATGDASRQVELPPATGVANTGTVTLTLKLNDDPVELTLDREKTPCTTNSFVSLAKQGFFDGTSCHRLADSSIYVLQCGDPTGTGSGGPGYAFADELTGSETYPAGTLAMANGGPDTNGSQFFIVYGDTTLQPNYTVFGKVDDAGLKTVRAIAAGGQDGSYGDGTGKPSLPAKITGIVAG